jgi:hypothetical protein
MKFSQADESVLVKLFGKEKADKLSGALKSDDGELSLDLRITGRVITDEEERTLKESAENQGKELRSKELAKELGLTLDAGEKDPVKIAEKLKTSIETTLEEKYKNPQPGEREKELETKLADATSKYDTLFETHGKTLKTIEEKDELYKGLETKIKVKERNNTILKTFPEKMKMDRNDALLITVNTFEFDEQDGKSIIKRDGEVVRNGAGEPETYENVIKSFVEEKEWVKGKGMNGSDRGGLAGQKGLTAEQAEQAIIKAGKDPGSSEGLKMFSEMTSKE